MIQYDDKEVIMKMFKKNKKNSGPYIPPAADKTNNGPYTPPAEDNKNSGPYIPPAKN